MFPGGGSPAKDRRKTKFRFIAFRSATGRGFRGAKGDSK